MFKIKGEQEQKNQAKDEVYNAETKILNQTICKISIKGQVFMLNQQQKDLIVFFNEFQVLSGGSQSFVPQVNICEPNIFKKILQILRLVQYDFPSFPPIKTSNIAQVIGDKLANYFQKMSYKDLNQLYSAAHFFKCQVLRRSIAAVIACRIYFNPTMTDYNKKKSDLGIKSSLNSDYLRKISEKYQTLGLYVNILS